MNESLQLHVCADDVLYVYLALVSCFMFCSTAAGFVFVAAVAAGQAGQTIARHAYGLSSLEVWRVMDF